VSLETVNLTTVERRELTKGGRMNSEHKPTPVMYDHCASVYDSMAQAAEETEEGLVYEGHTTKLVQKLGLPGPYYTPVMNHLKNMGCIEQLRRGGGSTLSQWLILARPTEEAFNSFMSMHRAPSGKTAQLEQALRDLHMRVTALEELISQ